MLPEKTGDRIGSAAINMAQQNRALVLSLAWPVHAESGRAVMIELYEGKRDHAAGVSGTSFGHRYNRQHQVRYSLLNGRNMRHDIAEGNTWPSLT